MGYGKQNTYAQSRLQVWQEKCAALGAIPRRENRMARAGARANAIFYSVAASFSMTTFRCAVTSLCSFTGMANSPTVFSGSCSWTFWGWGVYSLFARGSTEHAA